MSEVSVAEPKFIQIRKIRGYGESANQVPFEPDLVFKNTREVLRDYKTIVEKIPEHERYNIFFTLGYTVGESPKDRIEAKWMGQDLFFFDIDKIEIDKKLEYVTIFEAVFKIPREKFFCLMSGHGLHFFLALKKPIENASYFDKNRLHFQIICGHLNDRLKAAGLRGSADLDVFSPKRLGRLPLTLNRKPNLPENLVETITENLEEVDLDLKALSGLPDVDTKEQISKKELTYFRIDQQTVLDGCDYLKYARESASTLSEPEWYAALSIVGRLPDGAKIAHEISQEHPSYTPAGTDRKLSQALKSSGPRTCENIESMFPGCAKCPNYKKVTSPIQLKGDSFIATKDMGFHILKGKQLIPQYRDLLLHFEEEAPFLTVEDTQTNYRFTGTHWEERSDVWLENYAQNNFKPFVKSAVTTEFKNTILRNNLQSHKALIETTHLKANLLNGVYDFKTHKLLAHSSDFFFRELLPYSFDPEAKAPLFEKMLKEVTCGDEALQKNLQEYIGYIISGVPCDADKMLVLTGEGQNGKSRFLKIPQALVGKQQTKLTFTQIKSDFARMNLDGALLCLFEEVPKSSDKEQWELLKDWSAGGLVSACRKFENFIHFENKAKIVLTCNVLPQGTDPSHGYFRRLLIVPFNATFSEELGNLDRTIADRIIASELPGVFNWALEGFKRLEANEFNFTESKAMQDTLDSYKLHVDSTARFFEDYSLELGEPGDLHFACIKTDAGRHGTSVQSLYKTYTISCQDQGDMPLSQKVFTERLKTHLQRKFGGLWTKTGERDFELKGSVPNVSLVRPKVNKIRQVVLHGVRISLESASPEL
jgi:putative DNA primase/helicase